MPRRSVVRVVARIARPVVSIRDSPASIVVVIGAS
jgi:hypothetical protein